MSDEDRLNHHNHNYNHIAKHSANAWAENFISELNDTRIEADIRNQQAPPEVIPTTHIINNY